MTVRTNEIAITQAELAVILNGLALDEYRARADYGLTLDDDLSQLPEEY